MDRILAVIILAWLPVNARAVGVWELEKGSVPTEEQWVRAEQLIVAYAKEHDLKIDSDQERPKLIWSDASHAIVISGSRFAFAVAGYNEGENLIVLFQNSEPGDWLHEVGHAYGLDLDGNEAVHKSCEHFVDYCRRKWKTDKGKPKEQKAR